jgi:hypothetical protein
MGSDRPAARDLEEKESDADVQAGIARLSGLLGRPRAPLTALALAFLTLLLALERREDGELDRRDRRLGPGDRSQRVH